MLAAATTDAGQMQPADRELRLMGTRVRILVGPPAREGVAAPEAAAHLIALMTGPDTAVLRTQAGFER